MFSTTPTHPDLISFTPEIFEDHRGTVFESFRASWLSNVQFVQDNLTRSKRGCIRGLHYQVGRPQGKLVRVTRGKVLDVAVDLRVSSPYFGKSFKTILDDATGNSLWIPHGFAHGFLTLSETADFFYKCTEYYVPELQRCLAYDDNDMSIDWGISNPILSSKDLQGKAFKDLEYFD